MPSIKFLSGLLLCLFCQFSFGQQTVKYNNQELATLAKAWGLIKYYHPAVSQGKLDWDAALLNSLQSKNKSTVAATVQQWINLANKTPHDAVAPEQLECDSTSLKNFNMDWIKAGTLLNPTQKMFLYNLATHPKDIGKYYSSDVAQPPRYHCDTEKVYPSQTVSYRLLNLFRIWNVIEYFYPYKYKLDSKWPAVLAKYIPQFIAANDSLEYKKSITRLSAELCDTHTSIYRTYNYDIFGTYTSPFKFQLVDGNVVVTRLVDKTLCKAANIAVGDLINNIGGLTIPAIIAQNKQYMPASNIAVTYREAYNYLFSSKDNIPVKVKGFKKDGKAFSASVGRMKRIFLDDWDRYGLPQYNFNYQGADHNLIYRDTKTNQLVYSAIIDNIGYIYFGQLEAKKIDSLMTAMKDTKGIVIDLRGYNTDGSVLKIFNHLLPHPVQFGIKTQPFFQQPGKFCYADNIITKSYKYIGKENPDYYRGKVVALINEQTQSAEEMLAMVFKFVPNITFMGSQTAGADGNQTHIKMTDGREMVFSGLGIYYPDGKETQRIGIVPDMMVKPTVASIRANQDILVEKGFDLINKKHK